MQSVLLLLMLISSVLTVVSMLASDKSEKKMESFIDNAWLFISDQNYKRFHARMRGGSYDNKIIAVGIFVLIVSSLFDCFFDITVRKFDLVFAIIKAFVYAIVSSIIFTAIGLNIVKWNFSSPSAFISILKSLLLYSVFTMMALFSIFLMLASNDISGLEANENFRIQEVFDSISQSSGYISASIVLIWSLVFAIAIIGITALINGAMGVVAIIVIYFFFFVYILYALLYIIEFILRRVIEKKTGVLAFSTAVLGIFLAALEYIGGGR